MSEQVALVTGAAKRIGAQIATFLHEKGMRVILHYHHSQMEARALCQMLNERRNDSAVMVGGDIRKTQDCQQIIERSQEAFGRLDVLINNASSFYATPLGEIDEAAWEDLLGSNVKGPFFLSQASACFLRQTTGCIINITDIHGDKPLRNYPVYSVAKAGLMMLTKALAKELGPQIRVNGVAPGAMLWPTESNSLSEETMQRIIDKTPLKRQGSPTDIAQTVWFLIQQTYITGQIIAVDGGRSL